MSGWKLDKRRFTEEVFLPVRNGWDVRRNLFRFFQLPLDVRDDDVVEAAVCGIKGHLDFAALAGAHAPVAGPLRHGFDELATTVRDTALRTEHRKNVLADRRDFAEQVRAEMRGMPFLRSEELEGIVARARARMPPREVEEALAAAGVVVRDPVPLAVPVPPAQWPATRLQLRVLGFGSLAAYLTARKVGLRASADDVRGLRAALDRTGSGERLTAEETVLAAVERLVRDAALADALRRELIDELTDSADQDVSALTTTLARPDVRQRSTALGLADGGDLGDLGYAVLCRVRPVGSADARWREEFAQFMATRDLRAAHDVLAAQASLPPDMADVRTRLAAKIAAVDAELAAAAAQEATDPEAAAARYASVLRTAREPAAEAGLRRCPPPAPPAAAARVEGDHAVVTWDQAPVRTGDPGYRVVRVVASGPRAGRGDVAETPGLSVVDTDPPAGVAVAYEVTTVRAGTGSARPATTAPVVVLQSVTDLVAEPGDGEVRLRWRLPDGAVAVRLRRSGDDEPVELPAGTTTAHDPTARSGRHYTYAVEACYAVGDGRSHAAPAVVDAHPQAPPDVVADLSVDDEPDGRSALARWSPPGTGSVVLRVVYRPPPGQGTILRADAEVGEPVRVLGRDAGGVRIVLPADGRRRWVVPLTVAGELAVVGRAVEHDRRLPPVTGLRAVRQGHQVRLSWEWPPRAGEVRVLVREGSPLDGPADGSAVVSRISRAVYDQSGCRLPARPGVEQWFGVSATAYDDGQEVHGPLVQTSLGVPTAARYAVVALRRGRARVDVSGTAPLPDVQLRGRVGLPPLARTDGVELVTVRSDDAAADRMSAEFALVKGRPLHLRAFAAEPGADVELVPEDSEQLRLDRGRWT